MEKHLLPQRERYFKTALHVHTTVSDGFWTPEQLKECFKANGFSCVGFSDHNLIVDESYLNDEDFLALTSYEMSFDEYGKGCYNKMRHINVLSKRHDNLWQPANPPWKCKRTDEFIDKVTIGDKQYQCNIDDINAFIAEVNQHGFLCTYNHPDATSNMFPVNEDLDLTGLWGIEVYNDASYLCGWPNYNDEKFQRLLMKGERVFPIISDDCHSLKSYRGCGLRVGAKELTYEAMIEALVNGDFYSTNGPEIQSLTLDDEHKLHVSCTEVMYGCVMSHNNFRQALPPYRQGAPTGELTFDLTRWFDSIKTDEHREKAFFRLVLVDANGNRAYTRAYWWDDLT